VAHGVNRKLMSLLGLALLMVAPPAQAADPLPADTLGMDWSRVEEYRIVPGDKLYLNFGINTLGDEDFIREAVVRPDGRITVFPIGDVIAAGLTPRELQATVVSQLATQMRDPRVTVEVAEFAGNVIHVLGQVTRPGQVPAGPYMTVIQAITGAGGFSDDAQKNSVLVFQRDGARTVKVTRLRIDRAIKSGDLSQDMVLGRFDIVYVPRNAVGNLYVFTTRLFGSAHLIFSTALIGWELFNLDEVFVVPQVGRQ
jgi:polysaccharide export outer membrane protein